MPLNRRTPKAPPLDAGLLEYLSDTFPDRCPKPDYTDRQVWMAVGAQDVIKHLREVYKRQNDNILESR